MSFAFNIEIIKDLAIAIGAGAGAASVLSAIKDYLTKHQKNTIIIANKDIEITGSKDKDLENILEAISIISKSPQVFLAYSVEEKHLARRIARDLQANGIKVWLDENELKLGDSLSTKIRDAVRESQWVIFIPPKDSGSLGMVNMELKIALESEMQRQRPFIIPIKTNSGSMPEPLRDRIWADFSQSYQEGLQALSRGILRDRTDSRNEIVHGVDKM